MQQVVMIHGGNTFLSHEDFLADLKSSPVSLDSFCSKKTWKNDLAENLGADYQLINPRMPNGQNAQYQEWQIWLEKLLPFLRGEVILIGHSLGGLFLVKYLSANTLSLKIDKLIMLAAPFAFPAIGSFKFGSLEKVNQQCQNIVIMHSQDDQVVPVADAQKYAQALPGARLVLFKDKGHFNQEEFAELVEEIKE